MLSIYHVLERPSEGSRSKVCVSESSLLEFSLVLICTLLLIICRLLSQETVLEARKNWSMVNPEKKGGTHYSNYLEDY